MLTAFTTRPSDVPSTGRSAPQDEGLLGILRELGRLGTKDTMEALARYTGGTQYSFLKQNGLEMVLERLGEDIHSQYLVSFQPAPAAQPEYRELEVKLIKHPDLPARTRPRYWMR